MKVIEIIDCLNDCFLHQNIVMPTFQVKLCYDSNVQDFVISECENKVFQIKHHHPLGSIDHGHHVITFNYWYENSNKTNESFNRKLLYDKGNYEKLNDYFNFINWNEVFCD